MSDNFRFVVDPDMRFQSAGLRDVLAYWEAKRGSRPIYVAAPVVR
jgi:hypothetical protein